MGRPKKTNYVKEIGGKTYHYGRVVASFDGKRKEFTAPTYAEAVAKRDAYRKEWEEKKKLNNIESFGANADTFIETYFLPNQRYSERTKQSYLSAWKRHVVPSDLYDMYLPGVTPDDIQHFFNKLPCPESTKKKIYNLMVLFYRRMAKNGKCNDLSNLIDSPLVTSDTSAPTDIEIWTDAEWETILNSFHKAQKHFRYELLVYLAAYTGGRISELLALKVSDFEVEDIDGRKQLFVHFDRQLVPVEKNGTTVIETGKLKSKTSYRAVPLPDDAPPVIEDHLRKQVKEEKELGYKNPERYLFLSKSGKFLDRANVRRALERYYDRIGVPHKSIHTYRRTYGTMLCRGGRSLEEVKRLMGHSSILVTEKYYIYTSRKQLSDAVRSVFSVNLDED